MMTESKLTLESFIDDEIEAKEEMKKASEKEINANKYEADIKILVNCYKKEYVKKGNLYVCPLCRTPVPYKGTEIVESTGNIKLDCPECGYDAILESWKFDTEECEKHLRSKKEGIYAETHLGKNLPMKDKPVEKTH